MAFEAPGRWISELLFPVAGTATLLRLVYGTSGLSARTPIPLFDALLIVIRYAMGNIMCRSLLLVQLDRLRNRLCGR
ncbi:hypothetical protein PG989_006456 [Apiospora arundinis]